jgi:hypothetical protein
MEAEIRSCTRVTAMTGVGPSIHPAPDKSLFGPTGPQLESRYRFAASEAVTGDW